MNPPPCLIRKCVPIFYRFDQLTLEQIALVSSYLERYLLFHYCVERFPKYEDQSLPSSFGQKLAGYIVCRSQARLLWDNPLAVVRENVEQFIEVVIQQCFDFYPVQDEQYLLRYTYPLSLLMDLTGCQRHQAVVAVEALRSLLLDQPKLSLRELPPVFHDYLDQGRLKFLRGALTETEQTAVLGYLCLGQKGRLSRYHWQLTLLLNILQVADDYERALRRGPTDLSHIRALTASPWLFLLFYGARKNMSLVI